MSNRLIKAGAVAATIAAIPVVAEAQTVAYHTSSPVEIVAFGLDAKNIAWTGAGIAPAWAGNFAAYFDRGDIRVRFVNRSALPATSVTFVVNDGAHERNIVDKGNFRPGVLIEHTFGGYAGSSDFATASCAVAEVDFADGTAWHAAHTEVADAAALRDGVADSGAAADAMRNRLAELERVNAEARRVAFRHLGTSL